MNTKPSFVVSHNLQECLDVTGVSASAYADLIPLQHLLERLRETASTRTHYDRLNEWSKPISEYTHKQLDKYGFVNGDMESNRKKPNVMFWRTVYWLALNPTNSPNLRSETASHHASAHERNEVLLLEIRYLIKQLIK